MISKWIIVGFLLVFCINYIAANPTGEYISTIYWFFKIMSYVLLFVKVLVAWTDLEVKMMEVLMNMAER